MLKKLLLVVAVVAAMGVQAVETVLLKAERRAGYTLETHEFYPEAMLAVKAIVLVPDGLAAKSAPAAVFLPEDETSLECLAGEPDPYDSPSADLGRKAYFAARAGMVAVALVRPAMANAALDDLNSADSRKKYLALLPGTGWTDEKLVAAELDWAKDFLKEHPSVDAAKIAVNPEVAKPAKCPAPKKFDGPLKAVGKRMMSEADYRLDRADGRTEKTMAWAMVLLRRASKPKTLEFLKDRESFLAWQTKFLAPYRKDLENLPAKPEFKLLETRRRDGYEVRVYEFYPYDGLAMKTMILYPDNAQPGKTPVVVCMPGGGGSLECLAGEPDPYYNRYPVRNRQCFYYAKNGMIAVALTNHSTSNYCGDDWDLWPAIDLTLKYWKEAGFRRESLINKSVALCINFLKNDPNVDASKIACSGLSRGASVIHGAVGNPDVKALCYNDFVLDGNARRTATTVLPSGVTYGGAGGGPHIWMAMAPKPLILNEGGQYRGVIDAIKRAYELTGHPENLTIHWYDRYSHPEQRKYDDVDLLNVTGLTAEGHFQHCNVDAYDHAFHPESALPWINGLFRGKAEIPEALVGEVDRAMAERERSQKDLFPPDGATGRKAAGPKGKFTDEDLSPERPDGRTERTTTWAKMLRDGKVKAE